MMSREQFLEELSRYLHKLPKDERKAILADYEEHFEHGMLNGRTETEIAQSLGQPKVLAKEILAEVTISKAQSNPTFQSVSRAVVAVLGLGVLNVLFVLLPFIAGVAVVLSFFVIAIVCLVSPVLLLIQEGFTLVYLQSVFLQLGLVGVGILLILVTIRLSVLFYQWMIRYLRFNFDLVRRSLQ
jgi:uncharacterized membrane protein